MKYLKKIIYSSNLNDIRYDFRSIHLSISKKEREALKVELEALDEFLKCENESRKIEITSLDNFITTKYPEKVGIHCFH